MRQRCDKKSVFYNMSLFSLGISYNYTESSQMSDIAWRQGIHNAEMQPEARGEPADVCLTLEDSEASLAAHAAPRRAYMLAQAIRY